MGGLPCELWSHVLQAGVSRGVLDHRDLCSLSIASPALNRLASFDSLWGPLFNRDFSQFSSSVVPPPGDIKATYRERYQKVKAAKLAAHKRRVLRLQSQVAALEKVCKDSERQVLLERKRLSGILTELKNLEQASISTVALRLWQPETVRSRQHQVVQQQPVNPKFRQQSLEMEAKICKEEVKRYSTSIVQKRSEIARLSQELESSTYNPVRVLEEERLPPCKLSKLEKHKACFKHSLVTHKP